MEFFGPDLPNTLYIVDKMVDADTNEELDVARHPLQKFKMQLPFTVHPHDMVRLIKQKTTYQMQKKRKFGIIL